MYIKQIWKKNSNMSLRVSILSSRNRIWICRDNQLYILTWRESIRIDEIVDEKVSEFDEIVDEKVSEFDEIVDEKVSEFDEIVDEKVSEFDEIVDEKVSEFDEMIWTYLL